MIPLGRSMLRAVAGGIYSLLHSLVMLWNAINPSGNRLLLLVRLISDNYLEISTPGKEGNFFRPQRYLCRVKRETFSVEISTPAQARNPEKGVSKPRWAGLRCRPRPGGGAGRGFKGVGHALGAGLPEGMLGVGGCLPSIHFPW